jgi:hypothetical protein
MIRAASDTYFVELGKIARRFSRGLEGSREKARPQDDPPSDGPSLNQMETTTRKGYRHGK